jgi:hypothetical protein
MCDALRGVRAPHVPPWPDSAWPNALAVVVAPNRVIVHAIGRAAAVVPQR